MSSSRRFVRPARCLPLLLGVALATCLQVSPAPAADDNEKAVAELMRTGVARYGKKDFAGARDAFERAWRLKRHAAIAASLGEVELELGRYADAANHLSFYLRNAPSGRDTSDAQQQLSECKKHVGGLRVAVDAASATVFVNDRAIGVSPLDGEYWVDPGEHSVRAVLDERASKSTTVSVNAGQTRSVQLTLPGGTAAAAVAPGPAGAPSASPSGPPPAASPTAAPASGPTSAGSVHADTSSSVKPWVVLAEGTAAAAALGIGVLFVVQAGNSEDEAESLLSALEQNAEPGQAKSVCLGPTGMRPADCDRATTLRSEASDKRQTATVAFIAGGVLGLAAVGTYLLWPESAEPQRAGQLRVVPWSTSQVRGLQLQGSF